MSEELNVGQSIEYTIAGRTLILKPLALGKMKKAMMVFTEPSGDNMDKIARYLSTILDNNDGVTMEWVLENITLPEANEMVDASRRVNGLGSFFQKGGEPATTTVRTERPLEEQVPPIPSV